ncbi:MAG: hypothetical protein ACOH5I_13805 [Oligoflexus sp.]
MSLSSKIYLPSVSLALAGLLLGACGPKIDSTASSGSEPGRDFVPGPGSEMITVSVGLAQQGAFQLAGATAYEMALSGCASGLEYASITEANPNIQVYKNDLNCTIELLSFSLVSVTYVPDGAGFGSNWAKCYICE